MSYNLKFSSDKVKILKIKNFENLAVAYINFDGDKYEYKSSKSALKDGTFFIKESNVPNVRSLIGINKNEIPVFLLRGQLLKGGMQNRTINTTILVKGKSTINIPVNCVEMGRWSIFNDTNYRSSDDVSSTNNNQKNENKIEIPRRRRLLIEKLALGQLEGHQGGLKKESNYISEIEKKMNFETKGVMELAFLCKMDKEVFSKGLAQTDQKRIWDNVDEFLHRTNTSSSTSDYIKAHEKAKLSVSDYLKFLPYEPGSNGAIFFTYNKILGCDIISNKSVFEEYYNDLLESYAMSLIYNKERGEHNEEKYKYLSLSLFDELENLTVKTYEGIDMGKNFFFSNDNKTISGLLLDDDIIQISVMFLEK
ncbi:MAG: hypothetical protein N3A01_07710 [Bacteroidales bacterium]|nr:hypothetical protein [Bacteroidales bacterium]